MAALNLNLQSRERCARNLVHMRRMSAVGTDRIVRESLQRFVERMRALKVGDPLDETTEMGPLATEQILRGVDEQVRKSVAAGAKLLTGGNRIHGPGFFYEPAVLTDFTDGYKAIAPCGGGSE